MNITADKSQVMEIYCDWLKTNCNRYRYLTDEAKALYQKIKDMDIVSVESKEYYLRFMELFSNNPYIAAANLLNAGANGSDEQIFSTDYRCYFIKNRFGMWVPLELFCKLAAYKNEAELEQMQIQEQEKLQEDSQVFSGRSWSQIEACVTYCDSKKEFLRKYLKGKDTVKTHPIIAVVSTILVLFTLLHTYEYFYFYGIRNPVFLVTAIVLVLIMAYVLTQNVHEFINIRKKNKVSSSLKRLEQLGMEMKNSAAQAEGIAEDLKEFVKQMLKAGKGGISDSEIIKKGQIPVWSGNIAVNPKVETAFLDSVDGNIRPYARFRQLPLVIVSYLVLILVADFAYQSNSLPQQTSTEAQTEELMSGDIWRITAGECNLRSAPDGDVMSTLLYGAEVLMTDTDASGAWILITAADGTQGWISRKVAKKVRGDEIVPTEITASSELQTKSNGVMYADHAFDGNLLTSWQEGVKGYGVGEILLAQFEQSEINEIVFVNGSAKNEDSYYQNGRIKTLTMFTLDGATEYTFHLEDRYSLDGISLPIEEAFMADGLAFRIDEVYEGSTYDDTCIADIFIFGE